LSAKRTDPIERLVTEAKSPIMREVALMANRRHLTQASLAKLYATATKQSGVTGANVTRHFESEHPRRDTVDVYARLVGMERDHVAIMLGEELSDDSIQYWRQRLRIDLSEHSDYFESGVQDAIQAVLNSPDQLAKESVRKYILAECRGYAEVGSVDLPASWSPGVRALAQALAPRVKVRGKTIKSVRDKGFLSMLWMNLQHNTFDDSDVDAILGIVKAMLRGRGVDVAPMESELEKEKHELVALKQLNRLAQLRKSELDSVSSASIKKRAKSKKGKRV
jgi:hypothetical protein